MKEVTLLTTPGCQANTTARDLLTRAGVPFREISGSSEGNNDPVVHYQCISYRGLHHIELLVSGLFANNYAQDILEQATHSNTTELAQTPSPTRSAWILEYLHTDLDKRVSALSSTHDSLPTSIIKAAHHVLFTYANTMWDFELENHAQSSHQPLTLHRPRVTILANSAIDLYWQAGEGQHDMRFTIREAGENCIACTVVGRSLVGDLVGITLLKPRNFSECFCSDVRHWLNAGLTAPSIAA